MVPLDNPKQFFAEARVPSRRSRASVAHARCLRGVKLDQVGVARRFVGNCETRQMRRVPRPGRGSGGRRLLSSPCADSWQGLGCISVKGSSRDTSLGSKTAGETLKPPPPPPPPHKLAPIAPWGRIFQFANIFSRTTKSAIPFEQNRSACARGEIYKRRLRFTWHKLPLTENWTWKRFNKAAPPEMRNGGLRPGRSVASGGFFTGKRRRSKLTWGPSLPGACGAHAQSGQDAQWRGAARQNAK